MGKRSDFDRVERDFYPTPMKAVLPLLPHLEPESWFIEPCAGDGRLIDHLQAHGHRCTYGVDVEPIWPIQRVGDATSMHYNLGANDYFITNPPWDRKILHPIIENLSNQLPTWLLFDADWMHTKQAVPYLTRLEKVVSIGRVKWIEDSKSVGKDNCCWYLFWHKNEKQTQFFGRT
jgi:hypothetical protein